MTNTLLVVCDAVHQQDAAQLARALGADLRDIGDVRPADLVDMDVVVDVALRGPAAAQAVREHLGRRPHDVKWYFICDKEELGRAWSVQADALGATAKLERGEALSTIRRARSALLGHTLTPVPGSAGASIMAADRSMSALFDGLLNGSRVDLRAMSEAGRAIVDGVSSAGGEVWLETVKAHHEGTFQHCLLVMGVAAIFAKAGALDASAGQRLMMAAVLHDVGKAMVPRDILDKPDKLSDVEFALVKQHPAAGYAYLRARSAAPADVLQAVRQHHEALDGSGYPDGLKGDEILDISRMLTVCDIYAALIERRAYKAEKSPSEAISILVDLALRSKVDYRHVHTMAMAAGVDIPARIEDVVRTLRPQRRAAG